MNDICPDEEQLSAYADGELTESEALLLRGHLAACDPCGRRLEAFRGLSTAFRPLAAERMPLDLALKLERRIGENACRGLPPVCGWRTWTVVPLSLAASVTLTLGVLLGTALMDEPPPHRPTAHWMAPFELIPLGMCPSTLCHPEG